MNYGLPVFSHYTYNPYGILTRINTGNKVLEPEEEGGEILRGLFNSADSTILNYRYAYNTKGLMTSRSERIMNQLETFTYDNLDRLTGFTGGKIGQQGTLQTFSYFGNGNISGTSQLGGYTYGSKPHAVTQIVNNNNVISPNPCAVTYNFFNQPTEIAEGAYRLNIFYGADQQRNKTLLYKNDTLRMERRYFNKYFDYEYDKTIDTAHISRFYDYIYGDNGVVALHIFTRSGKDTTTWGEDSAVIVLDKSAVTTDSMYYIHTDHLGSYCAITNAAKQVRQRNWFDPWGNYPVKYDTIWVPNLKPHIIENYTFNFPLTLRGFTGHEHYPYFKIINMNGRLYDPVIARFFSPDKFVANGSFTQDFNRYSYARNCPLMYTDPDGEWVHFVIGAFIGGVMNLMMNVDKLDEGWKGFGQAMGYFGIGALAGALSAGIGAGVSGGMAAGGTFAAGFLGTATVTTTGFVAGFASGLASGFITGAGNSWMQGNNFIDGFTNGIRNGVQQSLIEGVTNGIIGGIDAVANGRNFFTGSYKTYKLQANQIASTDNDIIWEQYITPTGKPTVVNTDHKNVYYKPEKGAYGIRDYVKPGEYHYGAIDGVATSKYDDAVFKVPNGSRVKVLPGGKVEFLNPVSTRVSAGVANLNSLRKTGEVYEYGWMTIDMLDNNWINLFRYALIIKY
jgi:RHS repeat-associated protein